MEEDDTEEVPCVIAAACSLYNVCLFADDDDDEEDSDRELSRPQATGKRNLIVQYLQQL